MLEKAGAFVVDGVAARLGAECVRDRTRSTFRADKLDCGREPVRAMRYADPREACATRDARTMYTRRTRRFANASIDDTQTQTPLSLRGAPTIAPTRSRCN